MSEFNFSVYDMTKDPDYHLRNYDCEICGTNKNFYDMSTCDRCGRFICHNCSEAVVNRENNPFKYDFLCNKCIEELNNEL